MKNLPKIIFFLILAVFPFGQLCRLQLPGYLPGVRLHLIDVVVLIFVTTWFLEKIKNKEKFVPPAFFREMVFFGFFALISLLLQFGNFKPVELFSSSLYLLRLWNYFFFYWASFDFLRKYQLKLSKYLIWEGLVIAFFALIQYLFIPDSRFLYYLGWDEHYFRAIGTFLDPAFTALIINLSLISLLVDFLRQKKTNWYLLFLKGFFLITVIGLSFSRASYLSLAISLAVIFLFKKKALLFFVSLFVFVSIILLLPKPGGEGVNLLRVSSIFAKTDNFRQTIHIFKDHPFFGVGFNTFRFVQRDYGFISPKNWQDTNSGGGGDNSFLFVLATTGIFGFLVFLNFWLKIILKSFGSLAINKSALFLFSSTLAITISAFFVNSIFYPWIMIWLMMILAEFTAENEQSILSRSYFGRDQSKQF